MEAEINVRFVKRITDALEKQNLPEDQIDVFRSGAIQAYYALMEMYITTPDTFGLITEGLLTCKQE